MSEEERIWIHGRFAGVFVGDDDTVHALFEYEEPHYVIERLGLVGEARLRFARRFENDMASTILPLTSPNPGESQAEHEAYIARQIVEAKSQIAKIDQALAAIEETKRRLAAAPKAQPEPEGPAHPFAVINGDLSPG